MSRGAESAVFIDRDSQAVEIIKDNLKTTGLFQKATVLNADSVSYIKNSRNKFDIILLDPPYNRGLINEVLESAVGCCDENATIVCETDFNEALPDSAGDFEKFREYKYSKTKITTYKRKK